MKVIISKKDIFTIPNVISMFRIILAAVILWIFYEPEVENRRYALTVVLIISGLTDFLDGKIARRFHMVSELGKILDPIADKITQGVLLICLLSQYKALRIVFVMFLVKEGYMAIAGMKVLEKTKQNEGAMWYGKVNTAVFYMAILLLIFIPDMPQMAANLLIMIIGIFMMLSFVMYAVKYQNIMRKAANEQKRGG